MTRRKQGRVRRGVLAGVKVIGLCLTLLLVTPHIWAADCGDTTGPGGTRVPCQCGDRVTTNTILQPTDPVVSTDPADICSGDGLEVDTEVALNCNHLTLRGSGVGAGIFLDSVGLMTIEQCVVTGFEIGINIIDGSVSTVAKNEISKNTMGILCVEDCILNVFTKNNIFANAGDGLSLNRDSVDNDVIENQIHDNGGKGIVEDESCIGNVLTNNAISGNEGDEVSIQEENNTLVSNVGG